MLWIFLRMLASREILAENLARISPDVLQEEIGKLEKRLAKLQAGKSEAETPEDSAGVPPTPLERWEEQIVVAWALVSGDAAVRGAR
jgi:hypothetical protein